MKEVGRITKHVSTLLGLSIADNEPIYIGHTNIEHMKSSHPKDFERYGADLSLILQEPDYVGLNKKDNSLEFVKEYKVGNEFVKVAVRVSGGNKYLARSLYVLNNERVLRYIAKGTLRRHKL